MEINEEFFVEEKDISTKLQEAMEIIKQLEGLLKKHQQRESERDRRIDDLEEKSCRYEHGNGLDRLAHLSIIAIKSKELVPKAPIPSFFVPFGRSVVTLGTKLQETQELFEKNNELQKEKG